MLRWLVIQTQNQANPNTLRGLTTPASDPMKGASQQPQKAGVFMNPERFTIKAREAVQAAHELATERGHPEVRPLHLLNCLNNV